MCMYLKLQTCLKRFDKLPRMKIKNLFCSSSLTMYGGIARNKFYSSHLLFKHRVKRERRVRKKMNARDPRKVLCSFRHKKATSSIAIYLFFPLFGPTRLENHTREYQAASKSILFKFIGLN